MILQRASSTQLLGGPRLRSKSVKTKLQRSKPISKRTTGTSLTSRSTQTSSSLTTQVTSTPPLMPASAAHARRMKTRSFSSRKCPMLTMIITLFSQKSKTLSQKIEKTFLKALLNKRLVSGRQSTQMERLIISRRDWHQGKDFHNLIGLTKLYQQGRPMSKSLLEADKF